MRVEATFPSIPRFPRGLEDLFLWGRPWEGSLVGPVPLASQTVGRLSRSATAPAVILKGLLHPVTTVVTGRGSLLNPVPTVVAGGSQVPRVPTTVGGGPGSLLQSATTVGTALAPSSGRNDSRWQVGESGSPHNDSRQQVGETPAAANDSRWSPWHMVPVRNDHGCQNGHPPGPRNHGLSGHFQPQPPPTTTDARLGYRLLGQWHLGQPFCPAPSTPTNKQTTNQPTHHVQQSHT